MGQNRTFSRNSILRNTSRLLRGYTMRKPVPATEGQPVPFGTIASDSGRSGTRIKVVGVGGAGGNAVLRMAQSSSLDLDYLAVNTDTQALDRMDGLSVCAIGPDTTRGMGSGGDPEVGRKAIRESQVRVAELLAGADLVFVTAGMGGGTGTGAAATVADLARKQGALTVGVVTTPFSFEGPRRRESAQRGVDHLKEKVDTLITVDNNRLLPSLGAGVSLDAAFKLADEVLRQGVHGISEIVTVPGMINVDFADVTSVIRNGGPSFMAIGEGKGKSAATDAAEAALANPLFDAPIQGARGVLLNVKGGNDLALGQVHEVAGIVERASSANANVIFGVVQDPRWSKRVSVTLVATGLTPEIVSASTPGPESEDSVPFSSPANGHQPVASIPAARLI